MPFVCISVVDASSHHIAITTKMLSFTINNCKINLIDRHDAWTYNITHEYIIDASCLLFKIQCFHWKLNWAHIKNNSLKSRDFLEEFIEFFELIFVTYKVIYYMRLKASMTHIFVYTYYDIPYNSFKTTIKTTFTNSGLTPDPYDPNQKTGNLKKSLKWSSYRHF